jgi:quercetin dioxygenase-like cupin family protein
MAIKASAAKAKHLKWKDVPAEQLTPEIARRYVSGEKLTVARFELKRGCLIPEHQHENEQICSIFEGALKFVMGSKEFVIRGGEMLVIPPNQPHSAEALEDCLAIDVFAPPRADWAAKQDAYLRSSSKR